MSGFGIRMDSGGSSMAGDDDKAKGYKVELLGV